MSQTCSVKQRQSPAALGTLSIDMLLAHLVPNDVVICQLSPPSVDLRGLAERGCVEVAEDLEAQLGGERAEEVDLDEIADGRGYEGELRETALSEDTLQHEVAMARRGSGEERPDIGNALLVSLGFPAELLL